MTDVDHAVQILRRGGLVAFPTETVYGLGADATNARAVARIFQVKGRPANNPLIVHVAGVVVAKRYAARWSDATRVLAERFWPGPLTIVLPKTSEIVDEATARMGTVGLRAPDHELTLELLRAFDKPLAGPSANKSTHVSPTTAEHVRRALQVQRLLAERSQRGRKIPDLLIAAAAEQLDLTALHYDGDFDAIAAVTGQRCQRVVQAGSDPSGAAALEVLASGQTGPCEVELR